MPILTLFASSRTSAGPSTTVTLQTVSMRSPPERWVVTPLWVDTRIVAVPTSLPTTSPVLALMVTEPVPFSALKEYSATDFEPFAPTTEGLRTLCSFWAIVSLAGSVTWSGAATTFSLHVAFLLLKVFTVIVALPVALAVISPVVSSTVATLRLPLV